MFFQNLNHMLVSFEYMLTRKQLSAFNITTVTTNRIINGQAILLADDKVIDAMTRCGMHCASTRFERNVITQNHWHLTVIERMLQLLMLKIRTLTASHRHWVIDTPALRDLFEHAISNNKTLIAVLHQDIIKLCI